jgi:outer membrane biosynthesis protein TonB
MSALAHDDRRGALAASALLHAAVLTAGLVAWPWLSKPLRLGEVVPVTLVTSSQANMSPAVQAPTPAPAATETPEPAASPSPPAPVEAPTPAPPPTAKTLPQHDKPAPLVQSRPTPTKPAPAKPAQPAFDPDAVLASLDRRSTPAGSLHSAAPRGPTRPKTAVEAQLSPGAGSAVSQSALADLGGELQRLWNPNCDVEATANVVIKVSFSLDTGGRLVGAPQASGENAANPVVKAASDRAKRAVYEGSPFENLPPALYGQRITVNFNAQQFCANR